MAFNENVKGCHSNDYITNSDANWVPLALTHVEYPKGDWIGKLFALISLLPFSVLSGFIALILFRRDLHTIFFFLGMVVNEAINWIVKHLVREPRPLSRATQYSEYGMPSAHSQFIWFFTTYIILFIFIRLQHMNNRMSLETIWRTLLTVVCLVTASLVAYSRIYLQYHTWGQVIWGGILGSLNASLWFGLVYFVLTPLFPTIASWKISEFLLLRDTTLIPNVLWFEYTNSRQESRARSRKLVSTKSQ